MTDMLEPIELPEEYSRSRGAVSCEAFERFLGFLSPDPKEASRLYTLLHKRLVGFFRTKGDSDPCDAADVTIDRAVLKIADNTPVSDVNNFCLGIARNVFRERLRYRQREISSFISFIENLPTVPVEEIEKYYGVLRDCFEKLTVPDQELLAAYCQVFRGRARAECRRRLAESRKMSVLALRMRVTRLRSVLTDCVRKLTADNPAPP